MPTMRIMCVLTWLSLLVSLSYAWFEILPANPLRDTIGASIGCDGSGLCYFLSTQGQVSVLNTSASAQQWTPPSAPVAALVGRRDACVVAYRNQLFVIGGVQSNTNDSLRDLWIGSLPIDDQSTWRNLTTLPAGLREPRCVVFDNVVVLFDVATRISGMIVLATGQWSASSAPLGLAGRQPPLAHATLLRRADDVLLVGTDTDSRFLGWRWQLRDGEWSVLDLLAGSPDAGGAVRSAVVTHQGIAILSTTDANASSPVAAVVMCDNGDRPMPPVASASALAGSSIASAAANVVTNSIVAVTRSGATLIWHAGACQTDCAANDAVCSAGACLCPSGEFDVECSDGLVDNSMLVLPPASSSSTATATMPVTVAVDATDDEAVQIGVSVAVSIVCIALMACVAVAAIYKMRRMLREAAAGERSALRSPAQSDRDDGGAPLASARAAPTTFVIERLDSQAVATASSFPIHLVPASLQFVAAGDDSSDIAVDVPIATQITLSSDKALWFRFAPVSSYKFDLVFEPAVGALKANVPQVVTARLTPLCTTVVDVKVALYVASNSALENQQMASANSISSKKTQIAGLKHTLVQVDATSALSTKLDYDQLGLLRVAPSRGAAASDNHLLMGTWNGQVVAVKLLRIQRFDDPKIEQAFFSEIALLSKLKHRNVVPVYGASAQPGKLAVVTEYIEGGCVTGYIGEGGASLSRKLKLKIMLDAAEAIGFLHRCDILHRNVKPNNVMVVSTDAYASVNAKVTDFGSCRSLTDRVAMAHRVGIGRPVFTAPEILCLQPYSTSSDVYSFGMFVMYLLAEVEPFADIASHWEVVEAIVAGKRPRLDGSAIGDPALMSLVRDCWKPEGSERPDMRTVVQVCRDVCGVTNRRATVELQSLQAEARALDESSLPDDTTTLQSHTTEDMSSRAHKNAKKKKAKKIR